MKARLKWKIAYKEYYCEMTELLDELCNFCEKSSLYRNYIYDARNIFESTLVIRVPGRTTGFVRCDSQMRILEVKIDDSLIGDGKMYPDGSNEKLYGFIGQILELETET